MRALFAGIFCLIVQIPYSHASQEIKWLEASENCRLRIVIENPVTPVRSDAMFFIGFADRADNHGPLFRSLAAQGIRVISFDYPSHGESKCDRLDQEDFTS